MIEWFRVLLGGCVHEYPDYLEGVFIIGRYPNIEYAARYRECLYCRKRVAKR